MMNNVNEIRNKKKKKYHRITTNIPRFSIANQTAKPLP